MATTPRQTSYRVSLLPQVLAALDPDIDSYMSQATFFRPNRRLVNLWHLPLCFVDLDTYKTAYGKLHEEPLSLAVRQRLADVGIPPGSGEPVELVGSLDTKKARAREPIEKIIL